MPVFSRCLFLGSYHEKTPLGSSTRNIDHSLCPHLRFWRIRGEGGEEVGTKSIVSAFQGMCTPKRIQRLEDSAISRFRCSCKKTWKINPTDGCWPGSYNVPPDIVALLYAQCRQYRIAYNVLSCTLPTFYFVHESYTTRCRLIPANYS